MRLKLKINNLIVLVKMSKILKKLKNYIPLFSMNFLTLGNFRSLHNLFGTLESLANLIDNHHSKLLEKVH